MSLTRSVEYDAFGPWILPVSDVEDVPRAFRDYPFDFDGAEFILKLPRDILRRDATPDMHLYDRMLVVDADGLTVLTRFGDGFTTARLGSAAVAAIEHSVELLDGRLTVHGIDGTRVDATYNSSSRHIIAAVASRLIDLATGAGPTSASAAGETGRPAEHLDIDALGADDIGLVNAYIDAGVSAPGLRVLASHPGTSPVSRESMVRRLLIGRARLSGAVVSGSDSRLIVLSRRDWLRYRGKPDLSTRQTSIVLSRVTGVTASAHPLVQDVTTVTVTLGAGSIEVVVPGDSSAAQVLTDLRA